jgi:hypothetical protein
LLFVLINIILNSDLYLTFHSFFFLSSYHLMTDIDGSCFCFWSLFGCIFSLLVNTNQRKRKEKKSERKKKIYRTNIILVRRFDLVEEISEARRRTKIRCVLCRFFLLVSRFFCLSHGS